MLKGEPFSKLFLYSWEPENQARYGVQGSAHYVKRLAKITTQNCLFANFRLNFFEVLSGKVGEFFSFPAALTILSISKKESDKKL